MKAQAIKIEYAKGKTATFKRGTVRVCTHQSRGEFPATWSIRTGRVRLADGSEHDAILEFCDSDSGEHYGTGIWVDDGVAWQDDDDFAERLKRKRDDIFPYRYRYDGTMESDHHTGADGWS